MLQSDERDALQQRLSSAGIAKLIHYPVPPHEQKAYADMGMRPGQFPIAESMAKSALSLPIGSHLSSEAAEEVVDAIMNGASQKFDCCVELSLSLGGGGPVRQGGPPVVIRAVRKIAHGKGFLREQQQFQIKRGTGLIRTTVLFVCFNQEQFVRAAVRDVLVQDAPNLEIFLSDDCSTDNSFSVIQEEAGRYQGPHKVIVNRTSENLGLNRHINALLEMSAGDIIIPFAGDDRFRPDRAMKLADRLVSDDALLVHSYVDCIGPDDEEIPPVHSDATLYVTDDLREIARSQGLFIGATAAWRRDLFTKYGPLPEEVAYEDLILGFRAALEGRISLVEEPLVQYRVGTGASFQARSLGALDYRAGRMKNLMVWRNVLLARWADATTYGLSHDHPVMQDIQEELFDVETRLLFCGVSDAGTAFRKALVNPRRFLRTAASELNRHRRKRV